MLGFVYKELYGLMLKLDRKFVRVGDVFLMIVVVDDFFVSW